MAGLDPMIIAQLYRATEDAIAAGRSVTVVDKVTAIRLYIELIHTYPNNQTYLDKFWRIVLVLADVLEHQSEEELATRLRAIVARH